ncbi:MAG: sugar transferase [Cryomorphaceae bacterium]|nr:MAG: sugar transferase [Cryomorphaceae bacterium]
MNNRKQVLKYILADYVTALVAWVLFFSYRKIYLDPIKHGQQTEFDFDQNLYLGIITIPVFWLVLYAIFGAYNNVYRKHRLKELGQTLLMTVIGVLIIFFTLLLDDEIAAYTYYYYSLSVLFVIHFGLTFTFRYILTSSTVKRIHRREIGFNTIMAGCNQLAIDTLEELNSIRNYPGFKIIGFVSTNGGKEFIQKQQLRYLGHFNRIREIVEEHSVEEIIVALDSSEHQNITKIINALDDCNVKIHIIPDMYDILAGSVKMTSIFGTPLIQVNAEIMPAWQFSIKRIMDIVLSMMALLVLAPVYLLLAVLIKLSSPGPVFFKQERIGLHGQPFNIYKFRSMYIDAERDGPQLSSTSDPRITRIGRFLRKTRMDELPQFFNVLKGDMSLVGPRPERQYYIDKIMERAPHYKHLHKVRPGITSWGQVKYGYAENVDQMVQRLKYDVLYIENMSLSLDIKILAYTVLIILKGSGK